MRSAILTACIALVLLATLPARADQYFVQRVFGVATLKVGVDDEKHIVLNKLSLAVLASDDLSPVTLGAVRECAATPLEDAATRLSKEADSTVPSMGQMLKAISNTGRTFVDEQSQARLLEETSIKRASLLFDQSVLRCFSQKKIQIPDVKLAFHNQLCRAGVDSGCAPPTAILIPGNAAFTRFGKIADYIVSKNIEPLSDYILVETNNGLSIPAKTIVDLYPTMQPLTLKQIKAAFEVAVNEARQKKGALDAFALSVAKMSREDALRVADVISEPGRVLAKLPSVAQSELNSVSDEIARSRIYDCVKIENQVSEADIQKCTGYSVTNKDITACLSHAHCAPAFGTSVAANLAMLTTADFKKITGSALFARVIPQDLELSKYEQQMAQCSASTTDLQRANCLLSQQLTGRDKETFDCINNANRAPTKLAECAESALPDEAKQVAKCLRDTVGKSSALCIAEGALGPSQRKLVGCFIEKSGADAIACAGGPNAQLVLQAKACFDNPSSTASELAMCVAKGNLPPQANQLVGCAEQSTDYIAIAACMGGAQVSGDGGKLLRCGLAANGDPTSTGICMAAGSSLSKEQQILLQCATQSVDPDTYAACVAGQLALKEIRNCHGKHFGEGDCFGENNEFRKLARSLTGMDITDNTPIGQVINVVLPVADAVVTVGTQAITAVTNGLSQVVTALSNLPSLPPITIRISTPNVDLPPVVSQAFPCGHLFCN